MKKILIILIIALSSLTFSNNSSSLNMVAKIYWVNFFYDLSVDETETTEFVDYI